MMVSGAIDGRDDSRFAGTAAHDRFMIMQAFTSFMTDMGNVNWAFPRVKSRIGDHASYAHPE
jgi:hypothetical protein